jgi:hypothetical protein
VHAPPKGPSERSGPTGHEMRGAAQEWRPDERKLDLSWLPPEFRSPPPTVPFSFRIGLWPIGSRRLVDDDEHSLCVDKRCAGPHRDWPSPGTVPELVCCVPGRG